MFIDVETWVFMFWIGNWIGLYLTCHFISRYQYYGKAKYWDFELDWGISEVMHMFTDIASDVSMYWIRN